MRHAAQTKEEKLVTMEEVAGRLRDSGHKIELGPPKKRTRSRIALLALSDLRVDPTVQQRVSMDTETVEHYADLLRAGVELPAVVAFEDPDASEGCWLADGFHREAATRAAELEEILTDLRVGTRRDAIAYSLSANGSHGLRRTNADKRRAVETALADPEWSTWSDRAVAELCGVSGSTVASIRATAGILQSTTRTGRDGRTIDTSNIGKRVEDPVVPVSEPEPAVQPYVRWAHEPAGLALEVVERSYVADRVAEAGYKGKPASIPKKKIVDWAGKFWLGVGGSSQGPFFQEHLVSVVPESGWVESPKPQDGSYHAREFTVGGVPWLFDANHQAMVSFGPVPPVHHLAEKLRPLGAEVLTPAQWERWVQMPRVEREAPGALDALLAWTPEDDDGTDPDDPMGELADTDTDTDTNDMVSDTPVVGDEAAALIERTDEKPRSAYQRGLDALDAEHEAATAAPISESPAYDSDSWSTPDDIIAAAREVLGDIDLDPATNEKAQARIQATRHYTKEDDGLDPANEWKGRVWLNPPYRRGFVSQFIDRLVAGYEAGDITAAILLVNNCTDTKWCQELLARFPACFTAGRVGFLYDGVEREGTRQGQILFYLGPDPDLFRLLFLKFGVVMVHG